MIYGFGTREYLAAGLQSRTDDGYYRQATNDAPNSSAQVMKRADSATGVHHGRLHARKLHRPRQRHVAKRSAIDIDLRWFPEPVPVQTQPHPPVPRLQSTQGWNC